MKIRELYRKYERWMPIAFFCLGFSFDALVLHRIDEPQVILQQAAYLILSAWLIGVELVEQFREVHPPALISKIWKYREGLLHFMLGTLLNSYTIFYFKSSSAITSWVFIAILITLLILNEFKRFGKSQTQVHVAFWSLCLISYFVSLVPILLGFSGITTFLGAVALSCLAFWACLRILRGRLVPTLFRTHVYPPFIAIHTAFVALYFLHAIPPVPLSVSYLGIFHEIKKAHGEYELVSYRPWWRFWEHGDQTFYARPGDVVYCFARIFSPSRFHDQLQVRWFYEDPRLGWMPSDAIPLAISGGREEGYRSVTKKQNYQPGEWRVQVETADNREVGRIHFTVIADPSSEPREARTETQ